MCDASDYAIGAMLCQHDDAGNLRVIAYESWKLRPAECNYPAHEKELLGMIHALTKWRHYVLGSKVTVHTDNRALEFLQSHPQLSARQVRWLDFIAEYDLHIVHVPGKSNVVADTLSRNPLHAAGTRLMLTAEPMRDRVRQAATADSELTELRAAVDRGEAAGYRLRDGLLYKEHATGDRLYIPADAELRRDILTEVHRGVGHGGRGRTLAAAQRTYTWPGLEMDVREFVRTCDACQRNKPRQGRKAGLLQPLPTPEYPWQAMTLDLITGLPTTPRGHNAIVVFVDRFSKMVHYAPTTKEVTASGLADNFLDRVYRLHGLPTVFVSDRDTRFTAHFWKELFGALRTELCFSTAYHPETDGQTERANRTLEEILRAMVDPYETDWDRHLAIAEFAANSAVSAATGASPFQTVYGFDPPSPAQLISHQPATAGITVGPERAAQLQQTLERMRATMAKYNGRMAPQATPDAPGPHLHGRRSRLAEQRAPPPCGAQWLQADSSLCGPLYHHHSARYWGGDVGASPVDEDGFHGQLQLVEAQAWRHRSLPNPCLHRRQRRAHLPRRGHPQAQARPPASSTW
uniref:Integrase catalytic domain-containing protein n=1 Tax=Auxenochlorella protothecoides TaxID=3075 RepID=A0A1D1ZRR3_AUXPR